MKCDETSPLLIERNREKAIRYPRSIPFIIFNEFCERFNFYGLRTILLLYLIQKLNYDEDMATVIFHLSAMSVYLCCLFGAIIADSFWGKFKTILWLSVVSAAGSSIVAFGSVEQLALPSKEFTMIGLALIAIGSGGIKPCVAAFGGEQFTLPEQSKQLVKFFSIFYFSINIGSALTTIVTPLLRNTRCLGMSECFPAGFGLPAVLMLLSIVIFIAGQPLYKKTPPQGRSNMLVKVCMCIGNAISVGKRVRHNEPKDHWLDYAEQEYGKSTVKDTKKLLSVLVLFLPLPIFWALFEQQGSRWTEQALKMDGDLDFYIIKADQVQMANPILVLILIPLYEIVLYPLLSLMRIRRPLQKMSLGGILAGVAFILSMCLQLRIDESGKNSICMLWQLPQYIVMAMAEVIFSVTGLEFSFTQAPERMKSVVQACWMLTVAFGNMTVMLVVGSRVLESQAMEFLLFAVLMFLDILVFMLLAYRFKPFSPEDDEEAVNKVEVLV